MLLLVPRLTLSKHCTLVQNTICGICHISAHVQAKSKGPQALIILLSRDKITSGFLNPLNHKCIYRIWRSWGCSCGEITINLIALRIFLELNCDLSWSINVCGLAGLFWLIFLAEIKLSNPCKALDREGD